jgi:hypothetical protein
MNGPTLFDLSSVFAVAIVVVNTETSVTDNELIDIC